MLTVGIWCDAVPAAQKNKQSNRKFSMSKEFCLNLVDYKDGPVINYDHNDCSDIKYGFEGGRVIKLGKTYHLFSAEMSDDPWWVKMRLAYWASDDGFSWRRVRTLYETKGVRDPDDERFSLWSPFPIYNEQEGRWNIFYVAYRPGVYPDNRDLHCEGKIWRGRSAVAGPDGIGGPYEDIEIILRPDAQSQDWEGSQGTDSFFPYPVGQKWYAFYGSHNHIPLGPWQVGLAEADAMTGPWKRLVGCNPCEFEPYFIENPIVTRIEDRYVVIYDSAPIKADLNLHDVIDAENVGYSYSANGVDWVKGQRLRVTPPDEKNWAEDVRTPMCLVDEGDGTYTMFYSAKIKDRDFWAIGWAKLKIVE